jgi:hypothetical protein
MVGLLFSASSQATKQNTLDHAFCRWNVTVAQMEPNPNGCCLVQPMNYHAQQFRATFKQTRMMPISTDDSHRKICSTAL